MSAVMMEAQLAKALSADADLTRFVASVTAKPGAGVTVSAKGAAFGVWRWRYGVFTLMPADASRPSVSVETVAEAVLETRQRMKA